MNLLYCTIGMHTNWKEKNRFDKTLFKLFISFYILFCFAFDSSKMRDAVCAVDVSAWKMHLHVRTQKTKGIPIRFYKMQFIYLYTNIEYIHIEMGRRCNCMDERVHISPHESTRRTYCHIKIHETIGELMLCFRRRRRCRCRYFCCCCC